MNPNAINLEAVTKVDELGEKVLPTLVYFGEEYQETKSSVDDIYMSKTANPEATMTGKARDDTSG